MRTVVIRGAAPLPDELRELIERGSTSVVERAVSEVKGSPVTDADRIVFWSAAEEPDMAHLAETYAQRERAAGGESVLFISGADTAGAARFRPDELFVWPRDEDRLVMAFMTSA